MFYVLRYVTILSLLLLVGIFIEQCSFRQALAQEVRTCYVLKFSEFEKVLNSQGYKHKIVALTNSSEALHLFVNADGAWELAYQNENTICFLSSGPTLVEMEDASTQPSL